LTKEVIEVKVKNLVRTCAKGRIELVVSCKEKVLDICAAVLYWAPVYCGGCYVIDSRGLVCDKISANHNVGEL